jgi:hypothetical protein
MAIAKMHDFPIHGKSRIRLSWGRSQGDKQAELIRKVANFLGITYEASAKLCQGQDNMTIKQIASALGGSPGHGAAPAPAAPRRDVVAPGLRDDFPWSHQGAAADPALTRLAHSVAFGGAPGSASQGAAPEYYGSAQNQSTAAQASQRVQGQSSGSGKTMTLTLFDLGGGGSSPSTAPSGPSPYSHVSPSLFAPFATSNPSSAAGSGMPPSATSPYSHPPPGLAFSAPLPSNPYSSVHASQLVSSANGDRYQRAEFAQGGIKHYSPPGHSFSSHDEGGSIFSSDLARSAFNASAPTSTNSAFAGLSGLEDSFGSKLSLGMSSGDPGAEWEPSFRLYSGDGSLSDSARPRSTIISSSSLQSSAEQARAESLTSQDDYWTSLFGGGATATS